MILRSSIFVTVITIASLLVSFVNQLVIAKYFGVGVDLDVYLIAISIPTLVYGTLVVTMSYSMVPYLVQYTLKQEEYSRFCGVMLIAMAIVSCSISVAGFLVAPYFVSLLGSTLQSPVFDRAILISRIMWVVSGLFVFSAYLGEVHNSKKSFIIPAVARIFPFVGMMLFVIFLGRYFNVVSIVWGMFVGVVLSILFQLIGIRSNIEISRSSFLYVRDVLKYFYVIPWMIVAVCCFTVFQSIDAYWAPKIGLSNLASLGYCQRILVAVGSLIIAGPSVVIMPKLSESYRDGSYTEFFDNISRMIRTVLVFAVPLAIIISILAMPLVRMVFQRGAFDAAATNRVADLVPFMMLGMVPMLCVVTVFRAFFAKRRIFEVVLLGISMIVLYFSLSGIFSSIWGVIGIGLAYAASWWMIMFFSVYFLWYGKPRLLLCRKNLEFLRQLLIVNFVIGLVVFMLKYFVLKSIDQVGLIELILRVSVPVGMVMLIFYFLVIKFFKVHDAVVVFAFIESGFRKMIRKD